MFVCFFYNYIRISLFNWQKKIEIWVFQPTQACEGLKESSYLRMIKF